MQQLLQKHLRASKRINNQDSNYEISEQTIVLIIKLYGGDITKFKFSEETSIPFSSGIRQKCTGLTTLFELLTYKIMQ